MKTDAELLEVARRIADASVRSGSDAEQVVDVDATSCQYSPRHIRHVFEARTTVWRRYTRFDVVFDSLGAIVGYVDYDKYYPSPLLAISDDALLSLMADDPLLTAPGLVIAAREPHAHADGSGFLRVFVVLGEPARRFTVDVNTARSAIIAIRPEGP